MYVPELYAIDVATRHEFIKRNPFGVLIAGDAPDFHAVHIPFVLDRHKGDLGSLRTHMSLENPLSRILDGLHVLVVFSGPNSYVSPDWYSHPKQFPTWIYTSVHAYGKARAMTESELNVQLDDLVAAQEERFAPKAPWKLAQAPQDLAAEFRTMIRGFEIPLERLEGCFKLNQHKSEDDAAAMLRALDASSLGVARDVVEYVRKSRAGTRGERPKLHFEGRTEHHGAAPRGKDGETP